MRKDLTVRGLKCNWRIGIKILFAKPITMLSIWKGEVKWRSGMLIILMS